MYVSDVPEFVDYYSNVRDCIKSKSYPTDRSSKYRKARWTICNDENEEGKYKETFADRLADADEYLFKIEPSRTNTMEMLFEAEEKERMASEAEQNNEAIVFEQDGRIIGMFNLRFGEQLHHAGKIAEIMEFSVDADYRHKGIILSAIY